MTRKVGVEELFTWAAAMKAGRPDEAAPARLFRQPAPGDWASVLDQVRAELA